MNSKLIFTAPLLMAFAGSAAAQTADQKIAALEAKVDALFAELDASTSHGGSTDAFSFGGYGEYHANMTRNGGAKFADPHRFVFYMGYDFGAGIQLHSETEIEHGFVKGGNGEISVEQLYVDIAAGDMTVSIGRMLNPLGIINHRHEPPTFNGVERPNVEKFIIPSTWSQDGVGLRGPISDNLSYQLQYTGGLDASGFSANDGIRGGRMKERPGLSDMAISGRLDWTPEDAENLRVGFSFYSGGADSSNKDAVSVVGDVSVDIIAIDFDWSVGDFDLRGLFADSQISGASGLPGATGVGSRQRGSYLEAAYHVFDRGTRDESARFPDSDLVLFARIEDYDTQDELPSGATASLTAERKEGTFGFGWWLTPKFVIKADYQALDFSKNGAPSRPDQINLGIGWML